MRLLQPFSSTPPLYFRQSARRDLSEWTCHGSASRWKTKIYLSIKCWKLHKADALHEVFFKLLEQHLMHVDESLVENYQSTSPPWKICDLGNRTCQSLRRFLTFLKQNEAKLDSAFMSWFLKRTSKPLMLIASCLMPGRTGICRAKTPDSLSWYSLSGKLYHELPPRQQTIRYSIPRQTRAGSGSCLVDQTLDLFVYQSMN